MVFPVVTQNLGRKYTPFISILSDAAMKKVVDGASPKVIPHGPMSHKCAMGAENGAFRWPIFTGT